MKNASLAELIVDTCRTLFGISVEAEVTRPEVKFGDYATNIALHIAKQLQKSPRDIAGQIADELRTKLGDKAKSVEIAGPGFLNITFSDTALAKIALAPSQTESKIYDG